MADLLQPRTAGPATLRQRLADRDGPLVAPGVYDALGARLVGQAGFDAVYMTGFGTAASLLGRPDLGLVGLAEMADNARRIAAAVDLPLIADADTGYGNAVNVVHTVRTYEAAGVAALHIEDQVSPKRCGHLDGKDVVPTAEFVGKVAAAVAARSDPDLVVIARTDARAVTDLDDAIDRARRARDAGADMLFVEALTSGAELERVAGEFADTPLLLNWVEGGRTPPLPLAEVAELGFALVILPVTLLLAATGAMTAALTRMRADGPPTTGPAGGPTFAEFTDLIGLPDALAVGARFGPD